MDEDQQSQQQFQLIKKLVGNVWLAKRTPNGRAYADGEEFIARKVDDFNKYFEAAYIPKLGLTTEESHAKGLMDLLYDCNLGRNITHLLNHENLISLAGFIRHKSFNPQLDQTDDYLVWDYCDAGSLENTFADKSIERTSKDYMPESLCWHVLTSVLRALTWLHDGLRHDRDYSTGAETWITNDQDWTPVLHRNITPSTIFFQQPRGAETLGVCKLGNFEKAFVSGHSVHRKDGHGNTGFVLAPRRGFASTVDMRNQWDLFLKTRESKHRLYTISDEHWSLGAVLFRMMSGRFLPSLDNCAICGCPHIQRCSEGGCLNVLCSCELGGCEHVMSKNCNHPAYSGHDGPVCEHKTCSGQTVNIDDSLPKLGYSQYLRDAVGSLLVYNGQTNVVSSSKELYEAIAKLYAGWIANTEDGNEYIDVYDEMAWRYEDLNPEEADNGKVADVEGDVVVE